MRNLKKFARKHFVAILSILFVLSNLTQTNAQTTGLENGKLLSNGVTYDIRIKEGYNDIFIYDDSVFDKEEKLIIHDADGIDFPASMVRINREKLLEIKRKFYPVSQNEVRVTLSINVNDNKLLGLNYVIPKTPLLTKDQFKSFDAQIREQLTFELVYNNYLKQQKLNGWVLRSVILR